ncbi:MAG: signal peptidase I [Prevotellaceae bacterium]|nr:signal peptidase I [Prevotellaceae bacterium]
MRNALKFMLALLVTIILMLAFRALVFTTYTVKGSMLGGHFEDGDRVLVNRWSYGLRTGGGRFFNYTRWLASQPKQGDLIAFNCPTDKNEYVSSRPVYVCFCTGVPGDTINVNNIPLVVPGKNHIIKVTENNIYLLAYIYNNYEGKKAHVKDGNLLVDGSPTRCASFDNDYYWVSSGHKDNYNDSRFFGFVPENHIIGKVSMLLFSIDSSMPFYNCFRSDRWLLFIN